MIHVGSKARKAAQTSHTADGLVISCWADQEQGVEEKLTQSQGSAKSLSNAEER